MSPVQFLSGFKVALAFLTTLPVPGGLDYCPEVQGASLISYPVVGLLLGGLLAAAAFWVPLPHYLLAGVIVALWVGLTGGLHLDGLADCADAWMGGLGNRERTLELLKDPLSGSMAVIALVLVLLLKTLGIAAILDAGAVSLLLTVPLLSRAGLLALFLSTPYVRKEGLGRVLADHFSRTSARWMSGLTVLVVAVALPIALGLLLLATIALVLFLVRRAACARLGGFTGDVAGALVELSEVALLLVLAAWIT